MNSIQEQINTLEQELSVVKETILQGAKENENSFYKMDKYKPLEEKINSLQSELYKLNKYWSFYGTN